MNDLEKLLSSAGDVRARLSNPRRLASSTEAAEVVGELIAIEEQVKWLPDARTRLTELLTQPLEEGSGKPNHAFMAGLLLARWSPAGACDELLRAAQSDDPWCARMARMNLSWLARQPDNTAALAGALTRPDGVPPNVLADALAHQRDPGQLPVLRRYLLGTDLPANRAWVLPSLLCGMPRDAEPVVHDINAMPVDSVTVTATGLLAAYGHADCVERLVELCGKHGEHWHTAVYWAGRVGHPLLLEPLLDGMHHPDQAVRADLVNGLMLVGTPQALEAVVHALDDPAPSVSATATSHLAQLLGPQFDDEEWGFVSEGQLDAASRSRLAELISAKLHQLDPGHRYIFGEPLHPHALMELLYLGFLTSHTWFQFVSATGATEPFSPRKDLLYNLESMHALEQWHHSEGNRFVPGEWYYDGRGAR